MLTFLWIIILAVVAIALLLTVNQRRINAMGKTADLPSLERTIFDLQVGDIVQYMGEDWVVEGKLIYEEDGNIWWEYMLQNGDKIRWLSVEEDDQVEVCLLENNHLLDINTTPPRKITLAGKNYHCVGTGKAFVTRIGTINKHKAETCNYFDYKGENGRVMSIEEWIGEYEVTIGESIAPHSLKLLPGDGKSVYRV